MSEAKIQRSIQALRDRRLVARDRFEPELRRLKQRRLELDQLISDARNAETKERLLQYRGRIQERITKIFRYLDWLNDQIDQYSREQKKNSEIRSSIGKIESLSGEFTRIFRG